MKKIIFFFTSLIFTIILVLNTLSSNIQNQKSELILEEIKRTQDYNVNLATALKLYEQSILFFDIENLTDFHNCDNKSYENYTTCKSLKSANIIESIITEEMKYFYFDDTFIENINRKSIWASRLNLIQNSLLIIALLGGFYILLFEKESHIR